MRLQRLDAWLKWGCMAVAVVALCWVTGCSGGGATSNLSGQVTFDGQPVEKGTIRLVAAGGGRGQGGAGQITGGSYSIAQTEGMVAGNYKVMIMATRAATAEEAAALEAEASESSTAGETQEVEEGEEGGEVAAPGQAQVQFIPDKYNRATTLTVELAAGDNTKDFDLEK